MKKTSIILTALTVLAAGGVANAQSGTIAFIEANDASGTTGVNVTPDPIVTAIGSVAGASLDGYTYGNWAVIAQDSTGSAEVFGKAAAFGSYSPAVGDAINVTGTYSPFDAIAEIATPTSVFADSTGNALPTMPTYTDLSTVPVPTPLPTSVDSYYLEIQNVTILNTTGNPNFPTHANATYTIQDSNGNTMTMFQWASSYSAAGALGGTVVPTGPVNITGIVDAFSGSPELVPFSITSAVPEPSTIALATMGGGALLMALRRRK